MPHSATVQLDAELDRLEQLGVLRKAIYSPPGSLIVTAKQANDGVRICNDFSTGLHEATLMYQYPLPIPEDFLPKLMGDESFPN